MNQKLENKNIEQEQNDEYEAVLLVIKEVFVYQIPPRTSNKGHRANDWDVTKHLWSGRLRILEKGKKLNINLEDANTGELFGTCPYDSSSVEPVLDSTRYFVIKIVDSSSKKHAFVGIGFSERSMAFDFNVELQDYIKRVKNEKDVSLNTSASSFKSIDRSLKDGETFTISLGGLGKSRKNTDSMEHLTAVPLAPPPGFRPFLALDNTLDAEGNSDKVASDDEFGDFVSADS
ncbi:Adaptin ear-binding coat-associated protein 2 [Lobulomyces angularis]|nr:Adaptin ear-binding coat-associated protein 2 [Lobulomyces angularis]